MTMNTKHLFISALLLFAVNLSAQDTVRVQLHGTVLDAASAEPLPEVEVEWATAKGELQAVTFSNSDGRYALFVTTPGEVVLKVEENGYAPLRMVIDDLGPGESARELDLLLIRKVRP